jgi:hypothetical protein
VSACASKSLSFPVTGIMRGMSSITVLTSGCATGGVLTQLTATV